MNVQLKVLNLKFGKFLPPQPIFGAQFSQPISDYVMEEEVDSKTVQTDVQGRDSPIFKNYS
jgi:hypothetical protein